MQNKWRKLSSGRPVTAVAACQSIIFSHNKDTKKKRTNSFNPSLSQKTVDGIVDVVVVVVVGKKVGV